MTSQKCILSCTAISVPMFPYRSGAEEPAELAGLEEAARHPMSPSPSQGRGKGLDLTKAKALKPCSLHDQQHLESHVQSSGDKKPHQPPLFQPSVNTERTCSQMYRTA